MWNVGGTRWELHSDSLMIWARLQRFQQHTRMGGCMEWKKKSWTQRGGSIQNKKQSHMKWKILFKIKDHLTTLVCSPSLVSLT
jgi:hypothetical protein